MKKSLVPGVLIALSALSSCLNFAQPVLACGTYGSKYFDQFDQEDGVMRGKQWVSVTSKGWLIAQDMDSGVVKNYGSFGRRLLPYLDVRGGRACVVTTNEICIISLKTGRILQAKEHTLGRCSVGMIDHRTVFLNNGKKLVVMDMISGRTQDEIDLIPSGSPQRRLTKEQLVISHARRGDLVYVARPQVRGVAVVDLNKREKVQEITRGLGCPHQLRLYGSRLSVEHSFPTAASGQELLSFVDVVRGDIQTSALN
ncbi:MAG TPA: hypothetical protein DCY79_09705 [Planctomycetaceae bacterium]|nr:hypothetical protein [Blastopirellula sp.]HAY80064.1 hypothetical protein [Planctomycetaceae bacterium]